MPQIDIKVFAATSKARKHLIAFGNSVGALTAVDMATGHKIGTLKNLTPPWKYSYRLLVRMIVHPIVVLNFL